MELGGASAWAGGVSGGTLRQQDGQDGQVAGGVLLGTERVDEDRPDRPQAAEQAFRAVGGWTRNQVSPGPSPGTEAA